jgi:hypothetical protein
MKPTIKSSILTGAGLAVCALALLPLSAGATDVQHYWQNDQSVSAVFLSVDTNSCAQGIETFVTLGGGLSVVRDGSTTGSALLSVILGVWNYCSNSRLLLATGDTSTFEMQIDPNLKKGKLKGTVVLQNHTTGADIIADVDLAFVSMSKEDRSNFNEVVQSGAVTVSSHSTGAIRDAVASGTVKVSTTDYTPEPSFLGFIMKDAHHEVTITRQ